MALSSQRQRNIGSEVGREGGGREGRSREERDGRERAGAFYTDSFALSFLQLTKLQPLLYSSLHLTKTPFGDPLHPTTQLNDFKG